MGESGQVVVVPGAGTVQDVFEDRGMAFSHDNEVLTASYYSVELEAQGGGKIFAEQSASAWLFLFCDTPVIEYFPCSLPRWSPTLHVYQHR